MKTIGDRVSEREGIRIEAYPKDRKLTVRYWDDRLLKNRAIHVAYEEIAHLIGATLPPRRNNAHPPTHAAEKG